MNAVSVERSGGFPNYDMSNKRTLCELFESNKATLQQELAGMTLPKDLVKVQDAVATYLEKVFDSEGEFRQNLTQSEDYILEAAISLLNAQQKISVALTKEVGNSAAPKQMRPSATTQESPQATSRNSQINSNYTLAGAAGGAIAGKLLLGGWGAVFGAIAGVAVSVYLSNRTQVQAKPKPQSAPRALVEDNPNKPIDVDCFLGIIRDVCESVDNLIGTFRAQVNRVVQKYESIPLPTLESEYTDLLENIQALLGAYAMDVTNENREKRIEQRIQLLSESLENYDLQSVNYDGSNKNLFNFQPSTNVTTETMVLPAIIKEGKVVLKGKVFTAQ